MELNLGILKTNLTDFRLAPLHLNLHLLLDK